MECLLYSQRERKVQNIQNSPSADFQRRHAQTPSVVDATARVRAHGPYDLVHVEPHERQRFILSQMISTEYR